MKLTIRTLENIASSPLPQQKKSCESAVDQFRKAATEIDAANEPKREEQFDILKTLIKACMNQAARLDQTIDSSATVGRPARTPEGFNRPPGMAPKMPPEKPPEKSEGRPQQKAQPKDKKAGKEKSKTKEEKPKAKEANCRKKRLEL